MRWTSLVLLATGISTVAASYNHHITPPPAAARRSISRRVVDDAALKRRQSTSGSTACNNSPLLCSKSYSDVTYLGAHDAPFVRDQSTGFSASGNQFFQVEDQLSAGVRLLSAQVHSENGGLQLCHSSCLLLNVGSLQSWLARIKAWMDSNPNEVITILLVNSDNQPASSFAASFAAASLDQYAYTPASPSNPPTAWPTLQEMISQNKRLVVFVTNNDPSQNSVAPYLLNEFTFIFENPYQVTTASGFSCQPDRPSTFKNQPQNAIAQRLLPLMNHFLYDALGGTFDVQTPNTDRLNVTNGPSGSGDGNLGDFATTCTTLYGRKPTFFLVDFFNVGPAIATIDLLNGVSSPVGRKGVTTSQDVRQTSVGSSGPSAIRALAASAKAGAAVSLGAFVFAAGDWAGALGALAL